MPKARILVGDVRERLLEIPDGSVRTCVTSPPYFGLRDYGHDGQIGLEQTPEAYVAELVEVFREVRRVLADDGTLWLNLGDSYWGGKGASNQAWSSTHTDRKTIMGAQHHIAGKGETRPTDRRHPTIKPKDLIGIPWRVAFALQQDGWHLRSDIIWHKPNPMPESVRDRPTKAHEYLFLLSKSPRYYYDHEAVKELATGRETFFRSHERLVKSGRNDAGKHNDTPATTRNRRSVWSITTKPFRGAHFAVMPEGLVEPCVLAGSQPGDIVLDPFTGSGTVAVVALRHDRGFIGTELNFEYAALAKDRIEKDAPLMNRVELDFTTEVGSD